MLSAANYERDLPLGELVERAGLVPSNELYAALATARTSGRRLGEVLREQGLIGERDLAKLVAEQEGLEFIDLGKHDLDHAAVDLLSERTARQYCAIPFLIEAHGVVVAMADPAHTEALDAIVSEVPGGVRFVAATRTEVEAALTEAFGDAPAW